MKQVSALLMIALVLLIGTMGTYSDVICQMNITLTPSPLHFPPTPVGSYYVFPVKVVWQATNIPAAPGDGNLHFNTSNPSTFQYNCLTNDTSANSSYWYAGDYGMNFVFDSNPINLTYTFWVRYKPQGIAASSGQITVILNTQHGSYCIALNLASDPLPIQLASFKAAALNHNSVTLKWITLSETNNYGFYVQKDGKDITFVAGHGTTLDQHTYSYTDNPGPGQHRYGLKQVDLDGTATFSETILMDVAAPTKFALSQNYPNPFNPSTQIAFSVTKEGPVTLRVFDILGRDVATLVNENRKAGQYTERFDGSRSASGVYMYVLQTAEGRLTGRMILSK